jgi:replicative DNA helicase
MSMATQPKPEVAAEEAVLGAVMVEPTRAMEVVALLAPEDFVENKNRLVFDGVLALTERSEPVDLVTLSDELRRRGTLKQVGGLQQLAHLLNSVTTAAHLPHHARIVSAAAAVRRTVTAARDIAAAAAGATPMNGSAAEFLQESAEKIVEAATVRALQFPKFIVGEASMLRERLDAGPVAGLDGLRTGLGALDQIVCGMRSGELVVVGARPSVGKTVLVTDIALEAASDEDGPGVLLFSLEMTKSALFERIVSACSGVDHYLIRNRKLSQGMRQRVDEALALIGQMPLVIDDTRAQSITSLRAVARKVKQRHGLRLVVVDYLQLVTHPGAENRLQEVSAISRGLKALAGELGVPVVAAAQLNRAGDTGAVGRPKLSHLRESGTIEADADIAILLHQVRDDCEANEARVVEAIVAKNRNGPQGTARLLLQPNLVRFVAFEDGRPSHSGVHGPAFARAQGRDGNARVDVSLPGIEPHPEPGANHD